jgi:hypothetical protein
MSETVVYETARQAAAYWTKSLHSRARFIELGQGSVANLRRTIVTSESRKKALSKESIDAYESSLAELISEMLEESGTVTIATGFRADGILIQAAEKIGYAVSMLSLPYDTTMIVSKTDIKIDSVHRTQI